MSDVARGSAGQRRGEIGVDLRSTLFAKATVRLEIRLPDHAQAVYIVWGEDSEHPLWVGRSRHLVSRLGHHSRGYFADEIVHFDCYFFATDDEAQDAEAHTIRAMRPVYNSNCPLTIEERDRVRQWYRDRITYDEADRERVRRLVEEYTDA